MRHELVHADCDGGRATRITTFVNAAELVAEAARYQGSSVSRDWAESTVQDAVHGALYGDEQYVPGALELLADIDAAIPPTSGMTVSRSPYGAIVDFGDWVAGSPTPMRRKVRRQSETGGVRILLSFGPSASLGTDVLVPRGNAIMALVMKIQQYRPVELYLYDETLTMTDGAPHYFLVGVDCQPLSLAHVGYAVSHPGFFRHIGIRAEYQHGAAAHSWPGDMFREGYNARRDGRLGIRPEDVILSSATDWHPLIHRPVEWIKGELARIGIQQD